MSSLEKLMAVRRTAAQTAQDKNRDKAGKFQHGKSQENSAVSLPAQGVGEQMGRRLAGLSELENLSVRLKNQAAKLYCSQLSSAVRENYPGAAKVIFTSHNDEKYGLTLTFHSVVDSKNADVEVDPQFFDAEGARADEVDGLHLEDELRTEYDEDTESHRHVLPLDESPEPEPVERRYAAADYLQELESMSGALAKMEATAKAVLAVGAMRSACPELNSVTLGYSKHSGMPCVAEAVIGGHRFTNPKTGGDSVSPGESSWGFLDSTLEVSNYSDLAGKQIAVNDALTWRPGQLLVD